MEDVLVKTLEGQNKFVEGPSQENVLQLLEMTDQQSNYFNSSTYDQVHF